MRYDPKRHELARVPLAEWLEREFSGLRMFVVLDKRTGNWEIGQWMKSGEFGEVFVIGPSLATFDRTAANQVRIGVYKSREMIRALLAEARLAERRELTANNEEAAEQREFWRWFRRKQATDSQFLRALAGEV